MKATYLRKDDLGITFRNREFLKNMQDQAEEYREKLIEAVAEFDEDLMDKYLGGEEITDTRN